MLSNNNSVWLKYSLNLLMCLARVAHDFKTHQRVMHYSGRAIMSESHKIGRNWIVYLMERCNIVKVLRYKTENMGIELQILFHSSLLLSNRLCQQIFPCHTIHRYLYLPKNNKCIKYVPRRIDNSIILILLRTKVRLSLMDFLSNMLLFYVLYKS